ncbi:hypothetical protein EV128_113113 [Rhizobium azibense]|nr:hypothetical protein EV128_113113 [Rhizobium azibense]
MALPTHMAPEVTRGSVIGALRARSFEHKYRCHDLQLHRLAPPWRCARSLMSGSESTVDVFAMAILSRKAKSGGSQSKLTFALLSRHTPVQRLA